MVLFQNVFLRETNLLSVTLSIGYEMVDKPSGKVRATCNPIAVIALESHPRDLNISRELMWGGTNGF